MSHSVIAKLGGNSLNEALKQILGHGNVFYEVFLHAGEIKWMPKPYLVLLCVNTILDVSNIIQCLHVSLLKVYAFLSVNSIITLKDNHFRFHLVVASLRY